MSTTNPGDRSAADIEREVEETRARLTGTVEQLKERVSPSQVADQAMDWLRGSGGKEFIGNLGTAVRDNPVPVLLVAAGIGWLALSGRRDTTSRYESARPLRGAGAYPGESYPAETYAGGPAYAGEYGSAGSSSGPSIGDRVSGAAQGLRDQAGSVAGRAGDMANQAGETASEAWDSVKGAAASAADAVSQTGQRIADRASQAWSSATGSAGDMANRAGRFGSDAGRGMTGLVEANPLLLGALGVALGAAIGALIPGTEAEDRMMGETRDRVAGQVQELAGDAYQQAKDAAGEHLGSLQQAVGETYGRARDKLAESGIDPQAGAQALGEVARDLRESVERTAHQAADAARNTADRNTGRA